MGRGLLVPCTKICGYFFCIVSPTRIFSFSVSWFQTVGYLRMHGHQKDQKDRDSEEKWKFWHHFEWNVTHFYSLYGRITVVVFSLTSKSSANMLFFSLVQFVCKFGFLMFKFSCVTQCSVTRDSVSYISLILPKKVSWRFYYKICMLFSINKNLVF